MNQAINQENEQIKSLILKYWKQELSKSDHAELEAWGAQSGRHREWLDKMLSQEYIQHSLYDLQTVEERIEHALRLAGRGVEEEAAEKHLPRVPLYRTAFFRIAASLILVLGMASVYFRLIRKQVPQTLSAQPVVVSHDLPPGGNKAILTLGDGSTVVLDNAQNGTLSHQGNTEVVKLTEGQLAYKMENVKAQAAIQYNTVSTPRGGQFQLALADGSKVWLNAASSIRFPTVFTGQERIVEITGEAYFEVAGNAGMPFHVRVNDMDVLVLGTHFNINAYDDERSIKTTLLEGAVKVSLGGDGYIIAPGQQARLEKTTHGISVNKNVNTDQVVAWKNGLFQFDNADIRTIMRQMARWYDIDVVYEGSIPAHFYNGTIPKNNNASDVLKVLEEGGVHFKIEGKKVIVTP